jgi:hypothetical protein
MAPIINMLPYFWKNPGVGCFTVLAPVTVVMTLPSAEMWLNMKEALLVITI